MILAGEETLCVDGFLLQTSGLLGTVAQAFNPSTLEETEAGRAL